MEPVRQIIFQSDPQGGTFFPGLAQPVVIDPASLDGAAAAHLQTLVEDARFFDQPHEVGRPAPGAADYRCETLTIDNGTAVHSVRALVPIADPALRALFEAVSGHVKAIRAARRRDPQ
jgi:hypothetical protein